MICLSMGVRKIWQMGSLKFLKTKSMVGKLAGLRLSQLIASKIALGLFRKARKIDLMRQRRTINARADHILS